MAAPIIPPRTDVPAHVNRGWHELTTASAREGCTACGSQETEWLDPRLGRRCADHAPPLTTDPEENECPA